MNAYQVLGVRPTATDEEIEKAGRLLQARYHPDREDGGDVQKFFEVGTARMQLRQPQRKAYDLRRKLEGRTCTRCEGTGEVTEPRGFTACIKVICPNCLGSGDRK